MPHDSASPIRLVAATPADVPLLLSLIRELAEYEKLADECIATEDLLQHALFGTERVAYAVVAYDGDTPAGYALYFLTFSTFLAKTGVYLEDLYVRPAHRRRGIGRRLLEYVARIADERGGRLDWSVLTWNELALGVYRAIGARQLTDWALMRLTGPALADLAAAAPATPPPSRP
jgi:GNAT superfamily N-acetyltransferase